MWQGLVTEVARPCQGRMVTQQLCCIFLLFLFPWISVFMIYCFIIKQFKIKVVLFSDVPYANKKTQWLYKLLVDRSCLPYPCPMGVQPELGHNWDFKKGSGIIQPDFRNQQNGQCVCMARMRYVALFCAIDYAFHCNRKPKILSY